MASQTAITQVRDVKPFKVSWKIRVKVLHVWKQFQTKYGESLELILVDEMGSKMHATVRRPFVVRFERSLVVGQWILIENFTVAQAMGGYRPCSHRYKMTFLNSTTVQPCAPRSESIFLDLAEFAQVNNEELNPNILIDVIGQIVSVRDMEDLQVNNKDTHKLEFELRNATDERLACTLWGKFAEYVNTACQTTEDGFLICLIRFAKINKYRGEPQVTNSFDASQVIINPQCSELVEFKKSLPDDGLVLRIVHKRPKKEELALVVKEESFDEIPMVTISELISTTEVGKYKIMCTICAIDSDWAWYYITCKKCNHRVYKNKTKDKNIGKLEKKQSFHCENCNKTNVTSVIPRYKLHLIVMDSSATSKCLLFDIPAEKVVNCSADSLLNRVYTEIEDPADIPLALKNVIGKTFQFLISVEKENLWQGNDTFKVLKVLSGQDIANVDSDALALSDDHINPNSIVSGDQLPLMLTFSQEQSEDLSASLGTPSSKRDRILPVESGAESSTTKKHCTRIDNVVASNGDSPKKNDSNVDLSKRIDGAEDGVKDFDCVITGGKSPLNEALGENKPNLDRGLVEVKIEKP